MKHLLTYFCAAGFFLLTLSGDALDLKQSKFTQVVNDVQIISSADKSARAAAVNDAFKMPDILRTGSDSRAELVAEDQTITRVGANTVFSFDAAKRTIDLEKGSLLFHSPKGRGGGTVRTGSATASVLGTTIVVTTTPSGGFKVLVLEGKAEIKFLKGLRQHLDAGQMTFVLPGGGISPIIVFRLDENVKNSQLVRGFVNPLPSLTKIEDGVSQQTKLIAKGKAVDTGLLVGNNASSSQVAAVNPSTVQDYVSRQTSYQPQLAGNGYLTIDGFSVQPASQNEKLADALPSAAALSVDADIVSKNLDPQHIFLSTGPFNVTLPGNTDANSFLPNPFSGFFARNLNIGTPTIDLTPYAGAASFDFLAAKNLNIGGSLGFNGFVSALSLIAGGQILIAPGSTLAANAYNFYLSSLGPMHFDNVVFNAAPGGISLASLSDLALTGGAINSAFDVHLSGHNGVTINGTQINSALDVVNVFSDYTGTGASQAILLNNAIINTAGGLLLNGFGDVSLNHTAINAVGNYSYAQLTSVDGSVSLNGGSITSNNGGNTGTQAGATIHAGATHGLQIFAGASANVAGTEIAVAAFSATAGGSVNVTGGAAITAGTVILNAGDGILLDNVTMNGGSGSSSSVRLQAANTINVGSASHNVDMSSYASVNMSAHTLNLLNVAFGSGSTVNLRSFNGLLAPAPNSGQPPQLGYVNFINGVTYGGAPAQNYINNGIYLSTSGH